MNTRVPILLVALLLPLLSGCFYSREISRTQRAIERANPGVDFDRRFVFSMGRGSIGVLSEMSSFSRERDVRLVSDYLRNLKSVRVGMYELEGNLDRPLVLDIPQRRHESWQTLARVRDDSTNVSVLYRERFGEVRDLFVVALNNPDLVIVRLTGNFTELVSRAIQDFSDRLPRLDLFKRTDGSTKQSEQ